jgi:predicted nucleic acid-binding protein
LAIATILDANVAVRAVLEEDERAIQAFDGWAGAGRQLLAPDLWLPEAVSAIRRAVWAGIETVDSSVGVLADLFALPVTLVPTDRDLASSALRWAEQLGQSRAYDALYLAVAERFEAPLVTADIHLLNRCRQLGIDFVEGLPEAAG